MAGVPPVVWQGQLSRPQRRCGLRVQNSSLLLCPAQQPALMRQAAVTSRLCAFRSRWMTPMLCRYSMARLQSTACWREGRGRHNDDPEGGEQAPQGCQCAASDCIRRAPQAAPRSLAGRSTRAFSKSRSPAPHHLKASVPGQLRRPLRILLCSLQDTAEVSKLAVLCSRSHKEAQVQLLRCTAAGRPWSVRSAGRQQKWPKHHSAAAV